MTKQRTIFLATDGRYVTLASYHATHIDLAANVTEIDAKEIPGWLVQVQGDIRGKADPALTVMHTFGIAQPSDWPGAVAAFNAARAR